MKPKTGARGERLRELSHEPVFARPAWARTLRLQSAGLGGRLFVQRGAAGHTCADRELGQQLNFWLFGSDALGGGNPGNNQYPMVMKIDYVRFYKSNDELFYPCSPTPACLSDDAHKEDLDYSKNNSTDGIPTSPTGL